MILQIDTTSGGSLFYNQLTQLDGLEYLLEFIWSARETCWYLNIYDQNSNPIALFIRLVVTSSLLTRFVDPVTPPGVLFCLDTSGTNTEIATPDDLGARVLLIYVTADDPLVTGVAA